MARFDDILKAIGNTPMVKLGRISPSGGATIYGKCEFMNPGGSTKDRMAQHIIKKAMDRGELKPGGVIVENTSGNTGAGLAVIAAVHGCRLILTMPDKMSQEKIDMLRGMGAKVVVTPTNVPADSPDSYYETAKRIAREIPGAFYVNQYHNKDNIEAHYLSTGREIWEDMDGQIDALVVGAGTGGTISGVAKYLKERNPDVIVAGVDPIGSVYYDLFTNNRLIAPQVYKVEGIGEDMVCDALEFDNIDRFFQVNDKECFRMTRRLAREEGLFVGGSSGGAAHVAVKLARELGPDKSIVTVFPDSGSRYLSKVYSDEWMQVNGFLEDEGVHTASAVLAKKGGSVVWVRAEDTIFQAGSFLKSKNISQAPIADENGKQIGTITEQGILAAFVSGSATDQRVTEVMDKPLPIVSPAASLSKVSEVLLGQSALLVGENDTEEQVEGILSRIDIIEFLSRSA